MIVGQARNDAQHIAVHSRDRKPERDRTDRARGIVAHAGQAAQRRIRGRKRTAILLADYARGLVQIARAAVVPQPFPQLHEALLLQSREMADGRTGGEKTFIIRDHRFHACLLEHDFAQPYMVSVPVAPPWQVALVFRKPTEQRHTDCVRHCTSMVSPV